MKTQILMLVIVFTSYSANSITDGLNSSMESNNYQPRSQFRGLDSRTRGLTQKQFYRYRAYGTPAYNSYYSNPYRSY